MPTADQIIYQTPQASPMILSDRLLSLAQDAERAGCHTTAARLLALAHSVFDECHRVPQAALQ